MKANFLATTALAKDEIILLPGAQLLGGGRLHTHILRDVVKVGRKFYSGPFSVPGRPNKWVQFHGSLDFGKNYIYGTQPVKDTDEMIIDTEYGIRFTPQDDGLVTEADTQALDDRSVINNLETLRIERGSLVFAGQINMLNPYGNQESPTNCESCTHGTIYIHDAGRLIFEIGKNPANTDNDNMIISTLRAHALVFTGDDPRVFIQFAEGLTADEITKFRGFLPTSATTDTDELQRSKILVLHDKVYYKYVKDSDTKEEYTGSGLGVWSVGPSGGLKKVGTIDLTAGAW